MKWIVTKLCKKVFRVRFLYGLFSRAFFAKEKLCQSSCIQHIEKQCNALWNVTDFVVTTIVTVSYSWYDTNFFVWWWLCITFRFSSLYSKFTARIQIAQKLNWKILFVGFFLAKTICMIEGFMKIEIYCLWQIRRRFVFACKWP